MPSIKDVAEKAGVSVATVSRVLSNEQNVRPVVRDRVLAVIDELGYRRNRVASSLRKRSARVIGLSVSDICNPFFTDIARAIEDVANQQQMSVLLCNTDEDGDKEQIYLETLLDEHVAGIILSPTREELEPFGFLLKSNTPVVTIDRRLPSANVDAVVSDNVQSAHMLTTHLIRNGFRRIGAVIGLQNSTTGRERLQGFKLALLENHIPIDSQLAAYVRPGEVEGEKIVAQWLAASDPPDAILTGNSRLTIGALNAISKAGLAIPRDIALCGFDETTWMRYAASGITVISQPTYEIGKTAAELLFERIVNPARPVREIVLKGQLLARASTLSLRS